MRAKSFSTWVVGLICLLWTAPGFATDVNELQRQINILSDEIDKMKLGGGQAGAEPDRFKMHGYGELHYNNRPNGGNTEVDLHRLVLGWEVRVADWIYLNAEIDWEHSAQEVDLEFAYVDFLLHPNINARAGVVLIPVGFLNEFHEPPLFWSVERPELQKKIIPTTWKQAGVGFFGTAMEGVNYRLYAVNSLQSIRTNGFGSGGGVGNGGNSGQFRASDGIRKGRLQINEAIAEDIAVTGRLELTKLYPCNWGFRFSPVKPRRILSNRGGASCFWKRI